MSAKIERAAALILSLPIIWAIGVAFGVMVGA